MNTSHRHIESVASFAYLAFTSFLGLFMWSVIAYLHRPPQLAEHNQTIWAYLAVLVSGVGLGLFMILGLHIIIFSKESLFIKPSYAHQCNPHNFIPIIKSALGKASLIPLAISSSQALYFIFREDTIKLDSYTTLWTNPVLSISLMTTILFGCVVITFVFALWSRYQVKKDEVHLINGQVYGPGETYRLWPWLRYRMKVLPVTTRVTIEKTITANNQPLIARITCFITINTAELLRKRHWFVGTFNIDDFNASMQMWLSQEFDAQQKALNLNKKDFAEQVLYRSNFNAANGMYNHCIPFDWNGKVYTVSHSNATSRLASQH